MKGTSVVLALFVTAQASLIFEHNDISDTPGGLPQVLEAGPPTESQQLFNLYSNVNKFRSFAIGSRMGVEERHAAEQQRLQAAIDQSNSTATQNALSMSVTANSMSLLETRRIYDGMVDFANSLSDVLKAAQSKGSACEQMVCGAHASCTDTITGAQCVCNEGFVGHGNEGCQPPPQYFPHSVLIEATGVEARTFAHDLYVSTFGNNKLAIAFRDSSKGNIGRFVIGTVREAGMVVMSPPQQFTNGTDEAWSPQVEGNTDNKLLFAWRDSDTNGVGIVRGASMGNPTIRGATTAITFGNQIAVSTQQAHEMVLTTLPLNRAVLLYSDQTLETPHAPSEHFGNSALLEINELGDISILARQRFIEVPVCRIKVTKVTPSSFVLAARAGPVTDDMTDAVTNQEAIAIYGYMVDDTLVYESKVANLEPDASGVWGRSVSLIAPNTVAYAYQTESPLQMKMAILEVNPDTHLLNVTRGPEVVREGFSPYVGMISVPYAPNDPHTLMYYQDPETADGQVQLCSWHGEKQTLSNCEEFSWMHNNMTSVSGVHLGGGKTLMVFSPTGGTPFYTMFGVARK